MLQKNKIILALVIVIIGWPRRSQAEFWSTQNGGLMIRLSLSRIDTKQAFDTHASLVPYLSEFPALHDGEYSTTDISVLVEYGISDIFTIIGATQLRQSTLSYVDSMLEQRPNGGLGDLYFAGRMLFLSEPIQIAGQLGWKIPSADTGDGTSVALGNGEMDFDGKIFLGAHREVGGWPLFVESTFGMLFRGGKYDDAILYSVEFGGAIPNGKFGLHALMNGAITQGGIPPSDGINVPPGFYLVNNQTTMSVASGAFFRPSKKMKFFIDWSSALKGRGALAGNTIAIGIILTPIISATTATP